MNGSRDQRAAARKDAYAMATDLGRVSGMLEEVETLWRRAGLYERQPPSSAPGSLRSAARSLADAVRALPEADCEQHPALAFAAVAQLAALKSGASWSAGVTEPSHLGDGGMWTAIQGALLQIGEGLWGLICRLVKIGESSLAEAEPAYDRAAGAQPAIAGPGGPWQALAVQRTAIDALPETELRRLLGLIGGMDPAALQRAATIYTETFCGVGNMQASVAALRPVALACPISICR